MAVRPKTGVLAGQTAYTNSYAIIIGIGDYAFLPKDKHLDFAAKDATDLRDVLIRSYGFPAENVTLLLDEQATRANIEAALSALSDDRIKPDDRVLIYFSGHGQTVKLQDGGEMGFLIPHDAKVDMAHPENRSGYLKTCLRMDSLWGYLEASAAKHRLLLADACFGGLLIRGKALNGEKPNRAVIANLLARPALQAMTAGASNQEAQEDPKLGHSAYTFKLLEELKAQAATPDNVFLASELAAALKTSVANLTDSKQTPQFGNFRGTEGDFVFVATNPQQVIKLATPAKPVKPALLDKAELVYIPAGEFTMGSEGFSSENPVHKVYLDGYYIYKMLVTVKQYLTFCAVTGHAKPTAPDFNPNWSKADHPIVNVSWDDATAYCRWLSQQTGRRVTLPTEAQWEKAARGEDGREFPWGNTFDGNRLHRSATGTASVGSFPGGASPYGVLDMAGNVWQWCADYYGDTYYQSSPKQNPTGPASGIYRVFRGGSWDNTNGEYFRCALRNGHTPSARDDNFGFRCVVSAE